MNLFFMDDAGQRDPRRPGMGALVAVGGIIIPGVKARELEGQVDRVCEEFGFPGGEVFKWSPGKDHWMRDNVKDDKRQNFFRAILEAAALMQARAHVTIEDKSRAVANSGSSTHEQDVTTLALERFQQTLARENSCGVSIAAQPGGGSKEEERFLAECLKLRDAGSDYVSFQNFATNVLTSPFAHTRLLQVADLVTSCTTAMVAGNDKFAGPVFEYVRPLLLSDAERIGGFGLKLHPDYCFANLYHWLVGDQYIRKGWTGYPLPSKAHPYAIDPMTV
jgi:hypothetical protein